VSTNYSNTLIDVAPDCPVDGPQEPPERPGTPTVAELQYRMLAEHPYELTSDDLLFAVHAARAGVPADEDERARFFAKPQACLRSSPLGKRYGWATHHDAEGRVALVGRGTPEYERLRADPSLEHRPAMRSSRR
jgi:hypothetical protein